MDNEVMGDRANITVTITQALKNRQDGNSTTTVASFVADPPAPDGTTAVEVRSLVDGFILELFLGNGRLPFTAQRMMNVTSNMGGASVFGGGGVSVDATGWAMGPC